jgi:hypothetical protein
LNSHIWDGLKNFGFKSFKFICIHPFSSQIFGKKIISYSFTTFSPELIAARYFFLHAANQLPSAILACGPVLPKGIRPTRARSPFCFLLPRSGTERHRCRHPAGFAPSALPSGHHLHGNQASSSPSPPKTGLAAPSPPLPSEPMALKAHEPPPAVSSPAPPRLAAPHPIKGAESLLVQPRVHFHRKLPSPLLPSRYHQSPKCHRRLASSPARFTDPAAQLNPW